MSTKVENTVEVNDGAVCASPALGTLVPDYFLDLLKESAAEEVEHHLGDCVECRERYLTLVRVRGEARNKKQRQAKENARSMVNAETGIRLPKRNR